MSEHVQGEVCEYCGAEVAGGIAGCRELMTELTVRSPDARRLVVRRTFVDAYALQHVETQCAWPREVAAHLLNLCCAMEYNGNLDIYSGMSSWLSRARQLPDLPPPRFRGQMTVVDAAGAETIDDYIDIVRKWARCVWEAWYEHHDDVRGWIEQIRVRQLENAGR